MNVIIDACSIINLYNGGMLRRICELQDLEILVGPIVGGECSVDISPVIADLHDGGLLRYLADNDLDSDEFLIFVGEAKLGDGEAECISLARLDQNSVICCDDKRGRMKGVEILGDGRVFGSLRLLKMAVEREIINANEAFEAYELMRGAGGFLPDITIDYFQER